MGVENNTDKLEPVIGYGIVVTTCSGVNSNSAHSQEIIQKWANTQVREHDRWYVLAGTSPCQPTIGPPSEIYQSPTEQNRVVWVPIEI